MAQNKLQEENNVSLQADEIEALGSIYGDDWEVVDGENKLFSIDVGEDSAHRVHLQFTLPPTYPLEGPPIYQFSAPWMDRAMKNRLSSEIEELYYKNIGESVLFAWIEKVKEFVSEHYNKHSVEEKNDADSLNLLSNNEITCLVATFDELPNIEHGEPIVDRRSVFQAHLAHIVCVEQVNQIMAKLKENRKIASATHNIIAYRIFRDSHGTFYQDCDDDGENKAGGLLLHLLQILDVRNVLVVVTRWYGGVHLGSDRFKHISNAARNLLDKCGYIKNEKVRTEKVKKNK